VTARWTQKTTVSHNVRKRGLPMKLYEIKNEIELLIQSAVEYAAEHEGELPENFDEQIDRLELEKADKISNIIRYIKNESGLADMLKHEEDVIKSRRQASEKKVEWLKNYLAYNCAGEKYEDAFGKLSWRKSKAVDIYDSSKIPEQYIRLEPKILKLPIKEALENGAWVDGAALIEKDNPIIK
jgi:hypothetical protein